MITDSWMARKAKVKDQWNTEEAHRGAGRFVARITAGSEKLFYFRYTDANGKQVRYPLGGYSKDGEGGLTVKEARDEADRLAKLYQNGVRDIRGYEEARKRNDEESRKAAEEARKQAEMQAKAGSLRALLEAYVHHLEKQGKASAADVRRLLKLHVIDSHPALADRRAAELRARDLRPVLATLIDAKKGRTAGKVRAYISAACGLALKADTDPRVGADFMGFALELNPADALPALSEYNKARENNAIAEPDLREYLLELDKLASPAVRAALQCSLYLGGQRAKQLLRATPADLDMHAKEITLRDPKGPRKQPRLHRLPLTDRAAGTLAGVLKVDAPFVFTTDGKRATTVDTLGKAVGEISAALLKAKKIAKGFLLADMRATCETLMARHGIADKDLRGQIQSHGLGGIQARHYDRHDYMPEKRAALERWAQFLDELKAGERKDNVVAMRR